MATSPEKSGPIPEAVQEAQTVSVPAQGGAVLGVFFGLLVIVVALLSQLPRGRNRIDGMQLMHERFDVHSTPFGYPLIEARRLLAGEELLTFGVLEDIEAENLRLAAIEIESGGRGRRSGAHQPADRAGGSGSEGSDRDWSALPEGEAGQAPLEVALVWYPYALARRQLPKQFGPTDYTDIAELGPKGGLVLLESGTVDWDGYQVPYRLVRHFELHDGEAAFRDKLRANLTLGKQGNVLHLRWPVGVPGSRRALVEALSAFSPRPASEESPTGP